MIKGTEPLKGLSVVVAEDQLMVQVLLMDMLEELGAAAVHPVASVEEIEKLLEENRPDILTLDINLGDRLVYDVALSLRERGLPFIFVSGYSGPPDCPPELSGVPYVAKPLRLNDLSSALERALELKGRC